MQLKPKADLQELAPIQPWRRLGVATLGTFRFEHNTHQETRSQNRNPLREAETVIA
jgi:hypothetical protein